jgi:hypothetical protein
MPRRYCKDFMSDSELADSNVDPFEGQSETESGNPIPISLSVNNEPSPRQYRKKRSEAAADESIDAKSAMDEDEDCEIIEMHVEKAPERFVAPMKRASDKMVANFLNVARKFAETLEDMRKQELMQSRVKTSRKFFDFEDVHSPSRVRRQQPAQQRKPAQSSDKGRLKHQHSAAGSFAIPLFNTWRCRADWLPVAGESSEDVERWRLVRKYRTDAWAEMNRGLFYPISTNIYLRGTCC